ncbi:MAG: sulfite exporter TauE/SafE family protein [Alphaproteobacteria bacterium]|nr:sulfite exporter TauE/SafE family protein [Alphaproteobacteria bacterium]
MPDPLLPVILLTFLVAGCVKGVIGLGLPTIAVGLLSLAMTPAEAAALLVVPSLVTNLWQLAAGPSFAALALRFWPMMLGVCVGTWAGSGLLTGANAGGASTALGAALMVYALLGLTTLRLAVPSAWERGLAPAVGAATGLVTAATGVFVIPAVPYLQALGLGKDDLVQALGLSFTVSTVALALSLAREGAFDGTDAGLSLLALAPALGGLWLGQWLRGRISPEVFRRCFFLGLLALGAHLALRGML